MATRTLGYRCLEVLALMLAVGCGQDRADGGKGNAAPGPDGKSTTAVKPVDPPPPLRVRLALSKNIWNTVPIVANAKGMFEAEGVKVELAYVQAAKLAMDALIAGTQEAAAVVETNIAFLGFTANRDVSIVATVAESYDGAIVGRKSKGVDRAAALAGKKLGILQGTTSQIFADRFLAAHGIEPESVTVVNLQPVAIQTALVNGEIDAGSIWEPFVHSVATQLGDDAVVIKDRSVYTAYMNIAVRNVWAKDTPDGTRRLLRAMRKAEVWIAKNPTEAQEVVAREINLDVTVVRSIWDQYSFYVGLRRDALLSAIREEGIWIRKTQRGFAEKDLPDYAPYVSNAFEDILRERK